MSKPAFSLLHGVAVAAFLSANSAGAQEAPPPSFGLPNFLNGQDTPRTPENIIIDIFSAIPPLAKAVHSDMLKHWTDLSDGQDTARALQTATQEIQILLNEYTRAHQDLTYLPALEVDGVLGQKTAARLIAVAKIGNVSKVFINGGRERPEELDMAFLRDKLQELAPQPYINAMRGLFETARDNQIMEKFRACAEESDLPIPPVDIVDEEIEKATKGLLHKSDTVPMLCQILYLDHLPAAKAQDSLLRYLESIRQKSVEQGVTACPRTAPQPGTGIPRCVSHDI